MLRKQYIRLAALLAVAFCPAFAQAQFGQEFGNFAALQGTPKAGVSGAGTTVVERKPSELRMYMQLTARGKTLSEALAKLKERREAAAAQLESLQADKNSIVLGTPGLSNVQSARKSQIEAMVMAQMRSRGKKTPKGLQVPQSVTVTATLTARWPLEAESLEEMFVFAQGIQDKIKAADLAGAKEAEAISPEEEEFAEEAAQMANQFGEEQQQEPGQAYFVYVAKLPKEEREKAMADAFRKAAQQATDIAKAASMPRGGLIAIAGVCTPQNDIGQNRYVSYSSFNSDNSLQQMIAQEPSETAEDKQDEALSPTPGMLRFHCTATAVFGIGIGK